MAKLHRLSEELLTTQLQLAGLNATNQAVSFCSLFVDFSNSLLMTILSFNPCAPQLQRRLLTRDEELLARDDFQTRQVVEIRESAMAAVQRTREEAVLKISNITNGASNSATRPEA